MHHIHAAVILDLIRKAEYILSRLVIEENNLPNQGVQNTRTSCPWDESCNPRELAIMTEQFDQCPHEGNPDFYGLGIRVGIYLQLTTAIVAKYCYAGAIPENLTTNAIFLLALFDAVATATVGFELRPEEIVVLLQLCFGFLLSVLSILGGRLSRNDVTRQAGTLRAPPIASFLRLVLTVAICAYAVWFWFPGKDEMRTEGCPAYMFFLTRTSIYGGVRIFFQMQSILFAFFVGALFICQSSIILWSLISTLIGTFPTTTVPGLALALFWVRSYGLDVETLRSLGQSSLLLDVPSKMIFPTSNTCLFGAWLAKMTKPTVPLLNVICLSWTILSVELTLRFNRISGVYDIRSTGQLIPFVIGLVRFLSLCHGIIVRYCNAKAQKALLVRHPDGAILCEILSSLLLTV